MTYKKSPYRKDQSASICRLHWIQDYQAIIALDDGGEGQAVPPDFVVLVLDNKNPLIHLEGVCHQLGVYFTRWVLC